jgi:hypothetical protein
MIHSGTISPEILSTRAPKLVLVGERLKSAVAARQTAILGAERIDYT